MPTQVQLHAFNIAAPTEGLKIGEMTSPPAAGELAQDEVLVRLTLRPVDPADIFSIMGVYPGFQPASLPAVPGLEGTGVVEAVGRSGGRVLVGQRVVPLLFESAMKGQGSWQEYLVVKEDDLVVVPDNVNDAAAAQLVVNPFTAWAMLLELSIPQGEYLIVTAGGSALSLQLLAMCKLKGIKAIATARRAEHVQELLSAGYAGVIYTEQPGLDFAGEVKKITCGKLAYAAVDSIGGDITIKLTGAVRDGGVVIIYGAMSGLEAKVGIPDVLFRDVIVRGFWITPWMLKKPKDQRLQFAEEVMGLLAKGLVVPTFGHTYPLREVVKAIAHSTQPGRGAKIGLTN